MQLASVTQKSAIAAIWIFTANCHVALPWDLEFCEPQRSELRPFVTARFDTTVLIIHRETTWLPSWLPPLMPLCVWLGSVQFSVLNKWDHLLLCFVERDTPSVVYFILCFHKMSCVLSKKNSLAFYAFWGSCNFYFWSIQSSWNRIGILCWKLIHEHLDCAVQSFLTCVKIWGFRVIFGMIQFSCSFMDICSYKLVSVCIIISESLLVLL